MCEYVPVCDNYQCVHVQCNHSGGNDGPGDGLGLLFNFHFPPHSVSGHHTRRLQKMNIKFYFLKSL